jgi:hypothetical protein
MTLFLISCFSLVCSSSRSRGVRREDVLFHGEPGKFLKMILLEIKYQNIIDSTSEFPDSWEEDIVLERINESSDFVVRYAWVFKILFQGNSRISQLINKE